MSAPQDEPHTELRAAAEAHLAKTRMPDLPAPPVEKLLHELQVSQIELAMQNETLRQAQIALEESRDRYRHLYEFAPVGYLTLTAGGLIGEINLTGAKLMRLERKKLLQQYFTCFVTKDDQDRWSRHYLSMKRHKGQGALELDLQCGDGAVLHAQLDCVSQTVGAGETAIRITLTDIAQRKLAERETAHGLRRIESLMKHANDCIIMSDVDTRTIEVSDSCLKIYGYTREEMIGMRAADLRAPDVRDEIPRLVEQLTERGSLSYQTRHRRKDGSCFPIEVGATMIYVEGKRYFQLMIRDSSESQRQLEAMEKELGAASRRLSELSQHLVEAQEDTRRRLSGELHDRTSPNLAAIQINLGMLGAALPQQSSPEIAERLADTLALVEDTDASIREICADLRSPVLDYAGLAAAMEGYAFRYASRTGIAVAVDCAGGATRLAPALESLLFRIFQEALTNSLKHARAQSIKVRLDLDARPLALSIDDDGVGFDPERVGTGANAPGLGLLNMREMAEFAGGYLLIHSQPGAGTRIEVSIQP